MPGPLGGRFRAHDEKEQRTNDDSAGIGCRQAISGPAHVEPGRFEAAVAMGDCQSPSDALSARAAPVVVETHGRPAVVVAPVEDYERLNQIESRNAAKTVGSDNSESCGGGWDPC
jgi:hypothetical protein